MRFRLQAACHSTLQEAWPSRRRLPAIFAKARISGGKDKQRVASDTDFVRNRILAHGLFDDLNDEARGVIYFVAETGLRPVEACNLNRATIRLEHIVPHVKVRPDGRQMKTDNSWRDIPLVGAALIPLHQHLRAAIALPCGTDAFGCLRMRDRSFTGFAIADELAIDVKSQGA